MRDNIVIISILIEKIISRDNKGMNITHYRLFRVRKERVLKFADIVDW